MGTKISKIIIEVPAGEEKKYSERKKVILEKAQDVEVRFSMRLDTISPYIPREIKGLSDNRLYFSVDPGDYAVGTYACVWDSRHVKSSVLCYEHIGAARRLTKASLGPWLKEAVRQKLRVEGLILSTQSYPGIWMTFDEIMWACMCSKSCATMENAGIDLGKMHDDSRDIQDNVSAMWEKIASSEPGREPTEDEMDDFFDKFKDHARQLDALALPFLTKRAEKVTALNLAIVDEARALVNGSGSDCAVMLQNTFHEPKIPSWSVWQDTDRVMGFDPQNLMSKGGPDGLFISTPSSNGLELAEGNYKVGVRADLRDSLEKPLRLVGLSGATTVVAATNVGCMDRLLTFLELMN